ncbi:hypothetical protein AUC69_02975 [Methyloceanibacter superfactus]|uniref:DUF2254 domain-containing protein n=1 Tax=Methyloceanibacter superfactus TaxID=1774969 RepID=A0A1E3VMP5_9HYPH|nr:DUF2254 domain-containing protein [Methyloceanibacter superfactus]ODR94793.1 hypothetical protein AUC69_02975 [Methyloceanibacter superfactus]
MFTRLLTLWHEARSSLWALPLLMVAGAAAAAILAVHIPLRQGDDPVWFLYSGDAEEAPQFLSNLVTAMITMATLVVSITMVVLTLAAQQLGPRLIRSFMADRRTQATLGLFVATVVYLLLVLRSAYGGTDKVPNLAVTGGTALVLLCLIALLIFVHHLARSIIADNTIDRVGEALDADIARLLPESNGEEPDAPAKRPRDTGAPLVLHHSGYVQAINHHGLIEIADEADAVIELAFKPGRHVIEGGVFAWIAPKKAADETHGNIENCVILGGERASIQDVETSIRQLVEVALRALSPSISDPFTAMAVIDRLTTSIAKVMRRGQPQCVWAGDDGKVRLLAPSSTFADTVEEAFRQIRQHSTDQPAVLIRLVESLGQLLAQADEAQQPVLKKEIEIVLESGRRAIAQKEDLATLEERAKLALKEASAGR